MSDKSSDDKNRRRYPRVPLSLLIQYRFDTLDDFLSEYSVNISIGGMFIKTDEVREEGSLVYLQFYLRNGAKLIEGLGKVVRANKPESGDDFGKSKDMPSGMGIEFVNFDEESMRLIEQIVGRNTANARES
ncbi:MAG TPA: PilZ domain-containing protein [Myxococcota bacterium]|nr:PilZ domain-containing protein [Myxococcota bacterium]